MGRAFGESQMERRRIGDIVWCSLELAEERGGCFIPLVSAVEEM